MTSEHWTDRLSEYVDGEMSGPEREALEEHLGTCARCASDLEELRTVVAQASLLPELPPERDLWPAIASRLTAGSSPPAESGRPAGVLALTSRRRLALTIPQLAAAAIALVVLSAGVTWVAVAGTAPAEPLATGGSPVGPGAAATLALTSGYDSAVRQLEAEFERRLDDLDPETVRVVSHNLTLIDRAILEAGRALAEDPSSAFLSTHLANTLQRKVDLLRQVVLIETTET